MFFFSLSSECAVTLPPTVRLPVFALNVNAVAVVLTLAVWSEPAAPMKTG